MEEVNNEAKIYWDEKEKEKGGEVEFFTFATYLGRSSERSAAFGGLLYIINKKIYFEDFEKESWLLRLMGKKRKYEKTEFSIDINDITKTKVTSRNSALGCIEGYVNADETKTLSLLLKIISKPIVQMTLSNGSAIFFEIMKLGDFIKAVQEAG